jgi:hypothetical protein
MSSAGTRERGLPVYLDIPGFSSKAGVETPITPKKMAEGKQITVSESHRRDRKTGNYRGGGPFYTCRIVHDIRHSYVRDASLSDGSGYYSGPISCSSPSTTHMQTIGYKNISGKYADKNYQQMLADGTTAISLCNPVNSASDLGTSMAESVREGIPSLPGIQSWKRRTEALKALGSEYLNYAFGWAPLAKEVSDVRDAAINHRNIMKQYHDGEGRNTHRSFAFPIDLSTKFESGSFEYPLSAGGSLGMIDPSVHPEVNYSLLTERKRWFEGCFTYGLPSSTDSWQRHLGFGSQADQLFGIALSPDILWELTPWSWAVDWFTNTGEVINNITNFGLAGLVMRYGYMMEETIETITKTVGKAKWFSVINGKKLGTYSDPCSYSISTITKRRIPASPFGFGIGWEGLSPTQLAISAALGITRLL